MFLIDNTKKFTPLNNALLHVNQNNSSFKFKRIDFINHTTFQLNYKLNNGRWIPIKIDSINFSRLKQDKYNLKFRYRNINSDWQETSYYHFQIINKWYKQMWFYFLLISGVIGIIIYIYNQRLKRSKLKTEVYKRALKKNKTLQEELGNVRHKIAQDFHDDLGNKLATVAVLSNLTKEQIDENTLLYNQLDKISTEANFLYAGMRDFVWSLDKSNNKLHEVIIYLNDFGEKLFENNSFLFYCKHDLSEKEIQLP